DLGTELAARNKNEIKQRIKDEWARMNGFDPPGDVPRRSKGRAIQGARRFSVDDIATALKLANGRVHTAADYLRCGPNTIYAYLRENPELQELRAHLHERRGDIAESMLDEAVKAKEAWAIRFQLETQFKGRGYIERLEHTGADGAPLNIDATETK